MLFRSPCHNLGLIGAITPVFHIVYVSYANRGRIPTHHMCERGTYWDLGLAQVFSWAPHSGAATCIYLQAHDRPVAFYSDKHTVFRVANQAAKSGHGMTQFGRANRTLQDRLVKALRLAGISDIKAANAFLPECVERYNSRFAKVPQRSDNLHRTLNFEDRKSVV